MITMKIRISARLSPAAAAAAILLTSCDKAWEIGQKLKAPEEPAPELVEAASPITIPNGPDYTPPEAKPEPEPEPPKPTCNPEAEVSIFGYHDFADSDSKNNMVINVNKFREQMQSLADNDIPVISMREYVSWKQGEAVIPDKCVVITIDDGWEGVYSRAYPVLKEFGYPFSIYLYKNYVGGAGRSMSVQQILEMMANGCEVGSHSVSHSDMARTGGRSPEAYETWLREELGESLRFLRENFGADVLPVFAYPYGKYNDKVLELAEEYGYELGITVAPKKADHGLEDLKVGRYIIHGDNDTNITVALRFRGGESVLGAQGLLSASNGEAEATPGEEPEPLVTTIPAADEEIIDRQPRIEVNIAKLDGVSADSIEMSVSGLGTVPHEFDADSGLISYQMLERIHAPSCNVIVKLQRRGESKPDYIRWSFKVNRTGLYLEQPVKATPIEEAPAAADATEEPGEAPKTTASR